jgi:dTDP-4-amino-4,6-dideoxygalactose transaminase
MTYDVGPGDAIFTSPFTFIATAEVIQLLGATPVFVDIDRRSFNMNPDLLDEAIARIADVPALTAKGIIAVDIFGLTAEYDRINAAAEKNGLFVIEDAAQSFGAEYRHRKAGSLADIACTSFFPAKPLGCYGDGGMCFTDNIDKAKAMTSIRLHGQGGHRYDNVRIGINGRLDSFQAAVLLAKFELFPEEMRLRTEVADRYARLIDPIDGLTVPRVPADMISAWAQYTILAESDARRTVLRQNLRQAEIPTAVYYPKPLHLQPAFAHLGYREGDFAVSEECSQRVFSLPMHPYLEEKEQRLIADMLRA